MQETTIDVRTLAALVSSIVAPVAILFYFIVRLTIKNEIATFREEIWRDLSKTFRRVDECDLIISRERHDTANQVTIMALKKGLIDDIPTVRESRKPSGD